MSLVSSVLSSRRHRPSSSTGWRINIRLSSLMDSLAAIAFGLGLRFCIDTVGRYDFKLTGTLVGLWEGVIMLHFLKKAPRSPDPYIGFGVRLFIDFLFTESVARLVLVLIWTALGMVLADITPALWDEVGLRRTWRHLRRDLYTLTRMIPTVAFFPPPRTVRFSPSREPSLITEEAPTEAPTQEPDTSVLEPSIITTEQTHTPLTSIEPTSATAPAAREILKRRVPGHFPSGYSDTDTEIGSPRRATRSAGRTRDRRSMYPGELDTSSELSSAADVNEEDDLDDANRSSLSGSGSDVTERGGEREPSSTTLHLNMDEVPEMPTEEPLLVDTTTTHLVEPEEGELTPKQHPVPPPFYMPPTPSDSAARMHRNRRILEDRDREREDNPIPPPEQLPQIPDFLEEANTEDWEKIQREDAEERPPTPPEKDRPVSGSGSAPVSGTTNANTTLPVPPPRQTQIQTQTPSPDEDNDGWDTLDSQFLNTNTNTHTNANTTTDANANTTNDHTQPPPAYQSYNDDTNYDDIYDDPPAAGAASTSYVPDPNTDAFDLFGGGEPNSNNPWKPAADVEAEAKAAAARAKLQQEQEAERQRAAEAEAEEKRKREEAAAEAEALRKKKEEEKAERLRKEAADESARQKRREEEAAKEKEREQAAAASAQAEKTQREQAEGAARLERLENERSEQWWRKDAEEQRTREEAGREKKERELARVRRVSLDAKERKAALEADKRRREEEERVKKEDEDKKKKEAGEEEERKKREAEAAERAAAAEKRQKEEEEVRKAKEAVEAERLQREEEERVQREEEERKQREEDARKKEEEEQHQTQETEQQQELEEEPTQVAATPRPAGPDALPADDAAKATSSEDVQATHPPTDPVASPPTEDPEQNPDHDDAALQNSYEEESVVTEASEVSDKVAERLGNIILLKAQMAEIEEQISQLKQDLKAASEEGKALLDSELKAKEKILRKMQRKEQRRRGEIPLPMFADGDDDSSMDKLNPRDTEIKIEEKLEQLLEPGTKSLHYLINVPTGGGGKKQMPKVLALLERLRLFEYMRPDKNNARCMTIDVSEAQFNNWLKAYRISVTQADDEEDSGYY